MAVTERQVIAALMTGVDLPDRPVSLLRPPWMADGACLEHPELDFVPPSPRNEERATDAQAICGDCLVRRHCLAYALADPLLLGIWGGTTTAERRAIRLRVQRAS